MNTLSKIREINSLLECKESELWAIFKKIRAIPSDEYDYVSDEAERAEYENVMKETEKTISNLCSQIKIYQDEALGYLCAKTGNSYSEEYCKYI